MDITRRDSHPTAGVTGPPRSPEPWPATLDLAAVEAKRLLLHPLVLSAGSLSALLLWRAGNGQLPVLHMADAASQVSLVPLAVGTLLAANLAVLRARRSGTEELYAATRLSATFRILAHLSAILLPVGLAMMLVILHLARLISEPGEIGRPNPFELATGPALVGLGGIVGVVVARLAPIAVAAPLTVVAVTTAHVRSNEADSSLDWFGLLVIERRHPVPIELLGRPAGWHLLYLVGLALLLAAVALLRSQARGRLVMAAVAGLILILVGAGGQTRPIPADVVARQLQAGRGQPASAQDCQRRGSVTYCAFAGFQARIDQWDSVVRSVLVRVPGHVGAQPLLIRQRVDAALITPESPVRNLETLAHSRSDFYQGAHEGRIVPVGTLWNHSEALGSSQLLLGAAVASRIVGLPPVLPSIDSSDPAFPCNARATVALWLAAQASPAAAKQLRQQVWDSEAGGSVGQPVSLVWDVEDYDVGQWPWREAQYALMLLDRPASEVQEVLGRDWKVLTAAKTPSDVLAASFGLQKLEADPTSTC